MRVWFLVILSFRSCAFRRYPDKFDRYIISCHTTDFECFKRQYKSLRDNVLLGNIRFNIPKYEHYMFAYLSGTCIKLTGLQDSELTAITMEGDAKRFTIVLELPLRISQVKDPTKECDKPQRAFKPTKESNYKDHMMKFTGNATIGVTYPYHLREKNKDIYMYLEDENLDVILDIPDLSSMELESQLEVQLYDWSEWAFEAVQHVDAAEHFALPYTSQLRTLMERLPLDRFILLYPDEEYYDLNFSFTESTTIISITPEDT